MKAICSALLMVFFFVFPFYGRVQASVFINEFLPNPSGDASEDSEWIELYNPDSDQADVSGWKLDDADGGSSPYVLASGSAIVPGGFLVFEKSITNIALNNSGDTIRLLDPNDQIQDSYVYTQTSEDITIGRSSDGGGSWVVCVSQTKGASNNCPLPTTTATSTPAPTALPTATIVPTSTPTSMSTVTLMPVQTKTLTPKSSLIPTSASSLDILGSMSASVVTSDFDGVTSDTKGATPAASNMRPLMIALLMVAMGLALLTGVLVWQKKDIWKNYIQKEKHSN